MGMYNEVSHRCPHCKEKGERHFGESQISQIGPGFGGYTLDDLESLKSKLESRDLTAEQLKLIAECSNDVWFTCNHDDNHAFQADPAVLLAISMLADRFTSVSTDDTLTRAEAMLREIYPD
jgi:hypothetical protein